MVWRINKSSKRKALSRLRTQFLGISTSSILLFSGLSGALPVLLTTQPVSADSLCSTFTNDAFVSGHKTGPVGSQTQTYATATTQGSEISDWDLSINPNNQNYEFSSMTINYTDPSGVNSSFQPDVLGLTSYNATNPVAESTQGNHNTYTTVTSIDYCVQVDTTAPSAPTANPGTGTYYSPQSVTLSSTNAQSVNGNWTPVIYYTTDGTDPATLKTAHIYNSNNPITVAHNETIKAIAKDPSGLYSSLASFTYTFNNLPQPVLISPTNGQPVTPSGGSVTATWAPGPNTPTPLEPTIKYALLWSNQSDKLQDYINGDHNTGLSPDQVGNDTSASISNLGSSGTYYWAVEACYESACSWSNIDSFTIATAPTVTLLSPVNTTVNTSDPTLSWQGNPGSYNIAGYSLKLSSDPTFTNPIVYNGTNTSFTPAEELSNGTYYWEVQATDTQGNQSIWATGSFTINVPLPVVTIDSPILTNDTTPTLTGTVNEPTATVTLTVNGQSYTADVLSTGTWSANVTAPLSDGVYTLQAVATDTANNSSQPVYGLLDIDTVAPVVMFNNPSIFNNPNYNEYFGAGPDFSITATDSVGIKSTVIHIYDASTNTLLGYCDASVAAATTSCDTSSLPDGYYYVKAGANDNADNNTTLTKYFYVQNTLATPTNFVMENGANGYQTIPSGIISNTINPTSADLTWQAVAGADHYIVTTYYNGIQTPSSSWVGTPNSWVGFASGGFGLYGDGSYTFQACAYAASMSPNATPGISCATSDAYIYDHTKPTVEFTSPTPANNSFVNGNFQIGYEAKDNIELKSVNVSLYKGNYVWVATCYQNNNETTTSDSGTCTVKLPAGLASGQYFIQVGARDQAGNWSVNADRTINIDFNKPGIPDNLTALFQYDNSHLSSGDTLNITSKSGGNNLELLWSQTPDTWVTGYHILATYPDGSTQTFYQGPNTNAWLAAYDGFGQHGQGMYSYQVIGVNPNGDSTASNPFVLYYDTTPPTASLTTAPTNNSFLNGDFKVAGTASDNVGLGSVFFDVRNQSGSTWEAGCVNNTLTLSYSGSHNQSAALSCEIDTSGLVSGTTYLLRIHANDNAGYGNVNSGSQVYFTYDTAAPTTPVATPAAGTYTGTQSVSLTSSDAISGLASIYYTTNGSTPSDTNGTLYTGPISVTTSETIKAIAYDNAGNASLVFSGDYTINPVISNTLTPNTLINTVINTPNTGNPGGGGNVLGANTTTGNTNNNGQVKGDQTTTPNTSNNTNKSVKSSSNFLGLGWWWLLILAIIGLIIYYIQNHKTSDNS